MGKTIKMVYSKNIQDLFQLLQQISDKTTTIRKVADKVKQIRQQLFLNEEEKI